MRYCAFLHLVGSSLSACKVADYATHCTPSLDRTAGCAVCRKARMLQNWQALVIVSRREIQNANRPPEERNPIVNEIDNRMTRRKRVLAQRRLKCKHQRLLDIGVAERV